RTRPWSWRASRGPARLSARPCARSSPAVLPCPLATRYLPASRLGDDSLEHVQGATERLGGLGELRGIAGLDGLARPLAHASRLLDRILAKIRAADDIGDLREEALDLVEDTLGRVALLVELLAAPHLDHVILVGVDHPADLVLGEPARG